MTATTEIQPVQIEPPACECQCSEAGMCPRRGFFLSSVEVTMCRASVAHCQLLDIHYADLKAKLGGRAETLGQVSDRGEVTPKWTIGQKLLGATKALFRFSKSGFARLRQPQIDERQEICNKCPYVNKKNGRCTICGCFEVKLWLPGERCADKKNPRWLELPPQKPEVEHWAVGVTTSPRPTDTLPQTIESLRRAGFDPKIYEDPVKEPTAWWERSRLSLSWKNWLRALRDLVSDNAKAQAIAIFQDDVVVCRGLRTFLSYDLWPAPSEEVGAVSVYCSSRYRDKGAALQGCAKLEPGRELWGALGLIMPRASAVKILSEPRIMKTGGNRVDQRVRKFCRLNNLGLYIYAPSLAQHTGIASTMGHGLDKKTGEFHPGAAMFADDFVGEDVDITKFLMR